MSESRPVPEPFTVQAESGQLEDLLRRLASTRWPDQDVPNEDWAYGSDLSYLQTLVSHWRTDFDWGKAQTYLNGGFGCGAQHFTLRLPQEAGNPGSGLKLHFVRAGPAGGGAPLLLLHGWPGSFFEFHRLFPLLVRAGFEVVAPSLPGYVFSERPRARHFDTAAVARTVDLLMRSLGFNAYVAQGGDWGAAICRNLGQLSSMGQLTACKAIHMNMAVAPPPNKDAGSTLSEAEAAGLQTLARFRLRETGYQRIQGTKPQTLGFALADSPVGLLAWVVEKFRTWSDCGGHPERAIPRDEMLVSVMLYWLSGCMTSSMRLYYETMGTGAAGGESLALAREKVTIPVGFARFPGEAWNVPRSWVAQAYTQVVRDTDMPRGGHFAAWEVPELLAEEIRAFFLAGPGGGPGGVDARALCGLGAGASASRL